MSVSAILGQDEKSTSTTSDSKVASDKEMFLKLLVAQLSYQDPMNPVEDKEFIAQLAQFTSVEELQNIRSGIDTMTDTIHRGELIDAVSLIKASVIAEGNTLTKVTVDAPLTDDEGNYIDENGDQLADGADPVTRPADIVSGSYYTNEVDLASCTVTVRNASTNVTVFSEELGAVKAGSHNYQGWNGKLENGASAADGYYNIYFTGTDANGETQLITTEVLGEVAQVENIGGEYYLHLTDYRKVKYTDVGLVGYAN